MTETKHVMHGLVTKEHIQFVSVSILNVAIIFSLQINEMLEQNKQLSNMPLLLKNKVNTV